MPGAPAAAAAAAAVAGPRACVAETARADDK